MATDNFVRTYRNNPLLAAFWLACALALAVAYFSIECVPYFTHRPRILSPSDSALVSLGVLAAALYLVYLSMPMSLRFDPVLERYTYRWGVGWIARRWDGPYDDIDSVVVIQYTRITPPSRRGSDNGFETSSNYFEVCVRFKDGRNIKLGSRTTVMAAQSFAEQIASETALPFGGIYDQFNAMWIDGPYQKHIRGVADTLLAIKLERRVGHGQKVDLSGMGEKPTDDSSTVIGKLEELDRDDWV